MAREAGSFIATQSGHERVLCSDRENPWGILILNNAYLVESELMRHPSGQCWYTHLSGLCSGPGPICLRIWGYLQGSRSSWNPGVTTNLRACVFVFGKCGGRAVGHLSPAHLRFINMGQPTQIKFSQRGVVSLEVHLIVSFRPFSAMSLSQSARYQRDQLITGYVLHTL